MIECRLLQRAASVVGLAEVGSDHAGVGPGGCVLPEVGQKLDAALYYERTGLLQPHAMAAVAHVTLRVQQEVLYLCVCATGGGHVTGELLLL